MMRPLVPCGCEAPTRPGLVLDPFAGSGTTLKVARELGRDALGIELSPDFAELARERAGLAGAGAGGGVMPGVDGAAAGGRSKRFLLPAANSHPPTKEVQSRTKAEEVFTKTEALIASGTTKAEAFKQLAEEYGQPVNSIRGTYYQHTSRQTARPVPGPRRRETTPEDALADARAALERAIQAIDREVEAAKAAGRRGQGRVRGAQGQRRVRKEAIAKRLEALK